MIGNSTYSDYSPQINNVHEILFPMNDSDKSKWFLEAVMGCSHGCVYCKSKQYAHHFNLCKEWSKMIVRHKDSHSLLRKELKKVKSHEMIFVCNTTDPFPIGNDEIINLHIELANIINENGNLCRFLTKGKYPNELLSFNTNNHIGISLASVDENYRIKFEPYSLSFKERITQLKKFKDNSFYTWVNLQPYMTQELYKQDINTILNEIEFVDEIVFGGLSYKGLVESNISYYLELSDIVYSFCNSRNIKMYNADDKIKSEILRRNKELISVV